MKQTKPYVLNLATLASLIVGTVCFEGCSPSNPSTTTTATSVDLSIEKGKTPSPEEKAKLTKAKDALVEKLTGRLFEAMGQGGPAGAIAICSKEARPLAEEIGKVNGVRIGRVGVRLRNEANRAPTWAQEFVDQKTSEPQFVVLSNEKAAAFLPIKLQATCTMCHGTPDQISPEVKERLSQLYPNDQATGFQEGDLRGWFWIESL